MKWSVSARDMANAPDSSSSPSFTVEVDAAEKFEEAVKEFVLQLFKSILLLDLFYCCDCSFNDSSSTVRFLYGYGLWIDSTERMCKCGEIPFLSGFFHYFLINLHTTGSTRYERFSNSSKVKQERMEAK